MTAWDIIRQIFIEGTKEGSLGRSAKLNDAADLYLKLQGMLSPTDKQESKDAFNADLELSMALLRRKDIKEMREAGVMR